MQPVIVLLAAAWVGGMSAGVIGELFLVAGGVTLLLALLLIYRKPLPLMIASLALFSLGIVYGAGARPLPPPECKNISQLTGTIVTRPDIRENSVRYIVEDTRGCRFFVYADRWPVLERESVIAVQGGRYSDVATLMREQPDFGRYILQHRAAGMWSYPDVTVVSVGTTDQRYRALLGRTERVFVEPDSGIINAILLADRGQFPADLNEYFRRTSLTHILSISGSHISLLVGMIFVLVSLIPWPPWWRTTFVIVLLWAYVWFVGAPMSAARAGFFWTVALLAVRLGLLVSLPTAFILTLVLMVSWQPLVVLDIGLQLSFLAVLGIGIALFVTKPWQGRWPRMWRTIGGATVVSMGATIFTWPVISHYFGLVSVSAVVANLLVLPSIPLIMAGSMVTIAFSYISPLAAYLMSLPVHGAIQWLVKVATFLGTWPGMWWEFTVSEWLVALYYGALAIIILFTVHGQKRSWREIWE